MKLAAAQTKSLSFYVINRYGINRIIMMCVNCWENNNKNIENKTLFLN